MTDSPLELRHVSKIHGDAPAAAPDGSTASASHVARPLLTAALAALPLTLLGYGLAGWLRGWPLGVDSSVYRAGAALFLHGRSPYAAANLGYLRLSFTYPPAAALLFTPLAVLPPQLAWTVMAVASALALTLVVRLTIAAVPCWRFPAGWSRLLPAAMLCLLPVWRTIALGQVNVLLMGLVAADVLLVSGRGSRWGGVGVGVAAAVKLVPLIFIPHLFLTGNRAAAARALGVFAGLQALALLIAPQDRAYWTSYLFNTGRIGAAQQPYNQSLDGLLTRLTGAAAWSPLAAWAAGGALVVPAVLLMLRYHRRGHDVPALCVTACLGLLLAPVSWLPDWVWLVAVVVALMSWAQAGGRYRWAVTAAVAAVFTSTYSVPIGQQLHRTLDPFWFFVLSDPYLLTTIAIGVVLSVAALRPATGRVPSVGPQVVAALRDIDLAVDAGTMVAVLGPSGSGKSTLLNIAGGLEEPTSGEVLVAGNQLAGLPDDAKARLRRRTVGYVFQDYNLLPELTAVENVSLPLELDGVPARKARATGLRVLDALGLSGRAAHYPGQLSGGERQRVAIARAVVGQRQLLLADEPSGSLDSASAEAVMRLVHDVCENAGVAAVVVTHDERLAAQADRVVVLRDGAAVPVP